MVLVPQVSTQGPQGIRGTSGRGTATVPGATYLVAEEMAKHAAAPQVPDNDEAAAVADEDLVGVSRVLLQSFHHLKHPPVAGVLGQPGGVRGEAL